MENLAPIFVPIVVALVTAAASIAGSWLVFRNRRAEHIDKRIDQWTDRLESRVVEQANQIEALQSDVKKLKRDNEELRRWVGDVRRDLSAIHLCLDLAILSLEADDPPRATGLMRDGLERLEALLDETHSLVEDSAPLAEPIEDAS